MELGDGTVIIDYFQGDTIVVVTIPADGGPITTKNFMNIYNPPPGEMTSQRQ